jgi:5-formyltetrahydrofolate cyclo-ligase
VTALADIKAQARSDAFARRKDAFRARTPDDAGLLTDLLRFHAGRILSGYMPMRTEIDCLPAMAVHAAAGGRVCVPVIPGKAVPLRFREWTPDGEMQDGPFGAKVPACGDWIEPEVLVVPLLSFDRRGYRLGYGGGYYDRTLRLLRGRRPTVAIGFAFAAQEVPEVPTEPTDERLDLIVTEAEVIGPFA